MANPIFACSVCYTLNAPMLIDGLCGNCHNAKTLSGRKANRASETDLATGGKETGNTYTAVVEFSGDELTALREKAEATGQSYWQLIQDAVLAYQPPTTAEYFPHTVNLTPAQQAHIDAMGQTPQQLVDAALAERAQPSDERLWQAYLTIIAGNKELDFFDAMIAARKALGEFVVFMESGGTNG